MAVSYVFGGKTYMVARARCGYVTRAFLALPGQEQKAALDADAAADAIDSFYEAGKLVPDGMVLEDVENIEPPEGFRVLRLLPGSDELGPFVVEREDELIEDQVFKFLDEVIEFLGRRQLSLRPGS